MIQFSLNNMLLSLYIQFNRTTSFLEEVSEKRKIDQVGHFWSATVTAVELIELRYVSLVFVLFVLVFDLEDVNLCIWHFTSATHRQ